ncbi:hypothetical protein MTR_6g082020 [Medicago truncatula]|uniref:Transmembrane protein n=1 Tax=Medicago truncatula TaxID=3880 RepID=G7KM64_MEDTR|nr:hypothetical protein MTR_6g082020 [Medicago truncatula]
MTINRCLKVMGKNVVSLLLMWLLLPNVGGPQGSPRDPTVVSDLRFDEGFDRLPVSKVF